MAKSLTRNRAQMQNTNTYHRHGDMAMRRQGEAVENVGMPTFFGVRRWDVFGEPKRMREKAKN
jgi:hypothetical protein